MCFRITATEDRLSYENRRTSKGPPFFYVAVIRAHKICPGNLHWERCLRIIACIAGHPVACPRFARLPALSETIIPSFMELADSELARRFVLQGLLFQRASRPRPDTVHAILNWYLEAAKEGFPLPPVGVVADVGHLVFGDETSSAGESRPEECGPLPSPLVRQYEDLFLGKLYGDRSFERAADGLRRYADRRDRAKGLAFLLQQIGQRAEYQGVQLSLGPIRDLLHSEGDEILKQAAESLRENGPVYWEGSEAGGLNLLEFLYRDLIRNVRDLGEVLGIEDVFELEHGTAIAGFGQRLALRQTLKAAAELAKSMPDQPLRPLKSRRQIATQIAEEDTYPIGGFSSISNRGSIESLLHSQLAFMEPGERPDMFDIKFLRDELLYYSRDENQFLRRRRTFLFAFAPDLSAARIKDPDVPWQRIVLLLGLLRVAVERLTDWLGEEALRFEFVFLEPNRKLPSAPPTLQAERELLEILFRERIADKTVELQERESLEDFLEYAGRQARRSSCNAVILSANSRPAECEQARISQLRLNAEVPAISIDNMGWTVPKGEAPLEKWSATLIRLLQAWIAD